MRCGKCGRENTLDGIVGRNEVCSSCGADLRACINCGHYDPGKYNSCREPQAERVMDKEKRNFCDFFSADKQARPGEKGPAKSDSRSRLENLFKKS